MIKTDFDDQLMSFNRKVTSNKTKYLDFLEKLDSLTTKHNFFLSRMHFTSNDGSQSTFFIYQPTLNDTLKLNKIKVLITFLARNQREYLILLKP